MNRKEIALIVGVVFFLLAAGMVVLGPLVPVEQECPGCNPEGRFHLEDPVTTLNGPDRIYPTCGTCWYSCDPLKWRWLAGHAERFFR